VPEKRKRWESCNLSKKDRKIYSKEAAMYPTKQMKKQRKKTGQNLSQERNLKHKKCNP
jgi:hypothetical protein